jgi:serine/threonine protein kinase
MSVDAATPLTHLAGHWLGQFQLVQVIGVGAIGAVYLARDGALQRDVAIKLIAKGVGEHDPAQRERFLREARAAARLIHPNVVQIFQIGEEDYARFIAMEYVPGMTTAQAAKHYGGRLPEHFGIEKMREAAAALQLAGAHGITHRDIKPANLLLDAAGTLKVADFGLAYSASSAPSSAGSHTLEGTPFYMSPEQWTASDIGPWSDVYSLGCTFYHLLVGKTPFPARDLTGCFRAHCQSPVPDPKAAIPDIDPILAELLRRCMAKQAKDRPGAAQIVEVLDDMLILRRSNVRQRLSAYEQPSQPVPAPHETAVMAQHIPLAPTLLAPQEAVLTPRAGSVSIVQRESLFTQPPTTEVARSTGTGLRPGGATTERSYRDFFGLSGYPFSNNRQPNTYWESGPYAAALRALASQVIAGQRPAMLLGEAGSGRTFLTEMIRHRFPALHPFAIEPQLTFGTRPMVTLCRQVGVGGIGPGDSQQALLDAFLGHVLPDGGRGAIAIVVVDGVDPADRELLTELDNILRTAPANRLAMILVGEPDLPAGLASGGAPSRLQPGSPPVVLSGMTPAQMVEYIDFRMKAIGGAQRSMNLNIASQQLLHARSGGHPKLINVFCHNALTIASVRGEQDIKLETIRLAMKSKTYLTPATALATLQG